MGGGLYLIWLSDTHYYGGRTKDFEGRWAFHKDRLLRGIHGNAHMQSVFRLTHLFRPEILQVLETREDQIAAEETWLRENVGRPGCLNFSLKATGGVHKHSEETKRKMSEKRKGRPPSEVTRAATAAANRARIHTPESRAKMSESRKGKQPRLGAVLSQETKDKISKKLRENAAKKLKSSAA